jgi:hypothetical protein
MNVVLSKENFLLYAIRNYENPNCMSMNEFQEDLKKIKYIKRLINRYEKTGNIKERLVLNHIIVLCNMFGPQHTTRMLFFKIEKEYWSILKTFLLYLNILPKQVTHLPDGIIFTDEIPIHNDIRDRLRKV